MIHKTNKEEGKKHITMPLRVRISAVPASFKADFGRFRPVSAISVAGRYSPILAKSARFGANWSQFSANRAESARIREKKKKKNSNAAPTRGQPHRTPRPTSDSSAPPSQPHPCFLGHKHPSRSTLLSKNFPQGHDTTMANLPNYQKQNGRRGKKSLAWIKNIKDELLKKTMEGPPPVSIMLQAVFVIINIQKWLHKKPKAKVCTL